MEHPDVPPEVTTAAAAAAPMLERFYRLGGGSHDDFRTDLSAALAACRLVAVPIDRGVARVIDLIVDRREADLAFVGPDRRAPRLATR
jgi:hypothetical protein